RVAIVGPLGADTRVRPYNADGVGADPRVGPVVAPGSRGFVRLRLEAPAVLARGDRYILRAYSPPVTIAGGLILDPAPPRTAIRTPAALERAQRLDVDPSAPDVHAAQQRAIVVMLDDAGAAGLPVGKLTSRAAVDPADVAARV